MCDGTLVQRRIHFRGVLESLELWSDDSGVESLEYIRRERWNGIHLTGYFDGWGRESGGEQQSEDYWELHFDCLSCFAWEERRR